MGRRYQGKAMELPEHITAIGEQLTAGGAITPAEELFETYEVFAAELTNLFVKPWLAAHIGLSPPVTDFAADGFALTGGRVDEVAGKAAAVMVYAHGNHEVDLFAWSDRNGQLPEPGIVRGFRVAFWKAGDMDFAAVSDVDQAVFQKFIALARSQRE